nr:MAG TPA: hypothetical protein [Caudoviricetes sp.]
MASPSWQHDDKTKSVICWKPLRALILQRS